MWQGEGVCTDGMDSRMGEGTDGGHRGERYARGYGGGLVV